METVTITCTFDPGGQVSIQTNPLTVQIFVGYPASWLVSGLPKGYRVQLRFDPTGEAPHGLFNNLGPDAGGTSSGSDVEIVGDSFDPPNPMLKRSYPYTIVVMDPAGKKVGSQDPIIDNLGDPP